MPGKDKQKWQKTLRSDLMSSEESCSDDDDVYKKTIPWRAEIVNRFYAEIDKKSQERKTPQAHRQRMARKVSTEKSSRSIPEGLPKWAFKNY